ncbi:hypothetical protein M422DRAFT_266335 [Sphaerobolus stellatus SS14]|uniref:Uncharacterized protein n=1 Tax=Sphaerobolus stellatus (strain SS14) TaxID=990650 RepID=A0A0C9TPJ4_SPHS4|nr:hypothetical protein M422DRAFT_266335 [Sphaerobolus stellatus SS14]
MSKPENGECVIDLGISASPEADQPMVGLWNLTKVDASFAQAGTNTPRLFNVGTLADYSAVSAEYPIHRASVIQMRYCMAYNLIFEIVCGNIPENSDAYAANGTFHARINQIINLYTDAKQSSYGVRDELQASIQAVKALLPVAKQKMAVYVNAKTVIWIPFRIYFDFWIRRIPELKFLQTRVDKQRPSNACNLTLLNMYLMKTIVTNLSGDASRFPPGNFPSGTIPRVNHPQVVIPHRIHPQHIRRLRWLESGRLGWRQWSSSGGYMHI